MVVFCCRQAMWTLTSPVLLVFCAQVWPYRILNANVTAACKAHVDWAWVSFAELMFSCICNLSIGRFLGKSKREKQKGNPSQKKLKLQFASKVDETVPSKTYFDRHPFILPNLGCPSLPFVGSFIPLIRSPVAANTVKAMKAVWAILRQVAYMWPLRKTSRSD